jgi:hypothetical protein
MSVNNVLNEIQALFIMSDSGQNPSRLVGADVRKLLGDARRFSAFTQFPATDGSRTPYVVPYKTSPIQAIISVVL